MWPFSCLKVAERVAVFAGDSAGMVAGILAGTLPLWCRDGDVWRNWPLNSRIEMSGRCGRFCRSVAGVVAGVAGVVGGVWPEWLEWWAV